MGGDLLPLYGMRFLYRLTFGSLTSPKITVNFRSRGLKTCAIGGVFVGVPFRGV